MEDDKIVGGIPFADDLLFNFFNKDTVITDTYLLDPVSTLKLYPKKSNNLVTTSISTQFHVPKEYVDYTQGFTISMDLYYDPATHNETRYNGVSGRGNNTGFHSGMFMPGLASSTNFAGAWRNTGSFSTISKTGLTADWYRFSMIVTPTTVVIKLLNLRTNVELTGNTVSVGTVDNGDTYAYAFLCYGITDATGAYGSIGVNFSNITISRNGTCLLNVPFSSGADAKVVDICNKTQYTLGFFTSSIGWAKLSDYSHANFYYGYTLYTKSGSPNLYIPNAIDGSEITLVSPPTGYVRIANYKGTTSSYNQCESKFKLDDVTLNQDLIVTGAGNAVLNGVYPLRGTYKGRNWYYDNDSAGVAIWTHALNWDGTQWIWSMYAGTIMYYGVGDVQSPIDCTSWVPAYGSAVIGAISYGGEHCTLSGTLTPSDFNGEYREIGIWAGNKLFGKIGDESTKNIWKSGDPYDVYGWAIGSINSLGYWYEYPNGDGNDDTPNPWDVASFAPFSLVGATGTGILVQTDPSSNDMYLADPDHVLFTENTGVAKEFNISDIDFNYDRGYLYINSDVQETNFMLYKADKTLTNDLKVLKYVEQIDRVSYDEETGLPNYDEANHAELTE